MKTKLFLSLLMCTMLHTNALPSDVQKLMQAQQNITATGMQSMRSFTDSELSPFSEQARNDIKYLTTYKPKPQVQIDPSGEIKSLAPTKEQETSLLTAVKALVGKKLKGKGFWYAAYCFGIYMADKHILEMSEEKIGLLKSILTIYEELQYSSAYFYDGTVYPLDPKQHINMKQQLLKALKEHQPKALEDFQSFAPHFNAIVTGDVLEQNVAEELKKLNEAYQYFAQMQMLYDHLPNLSGIGIVLPNWMKPLAQGITDLLKIMYPIMNDKNQVPYRFAAMLMFGNRNIIENGAYTADFLAKAVKKIPAQNASTTQSAAAGTQLAGTETPSTVTDAQLAAS